MCKINKDMVNKVIKAQGISKAELSRRLNKNVNYINYIISEGQMPENVLEDMAEILNVDKQVFLYNPKTDELEELKLIEDSGKSDFEQYILHGETKDMCATRKGKGKKEYTPVEMEELLNDYRKAKGVTKEEEHALLSAYEATKVTTVDGSSMLIPIVCLHAVKWQRDTVVKRSLRMANEYSSIQFDKIKVKFVDGVPYVIDGLHRVLAYYLIVTDDELRKSLKEKYPNKDFNYISVEIAEGTMEECKKAFLTQGISRANMSSPDLWRASLDNKVATNVNFKEIMKSCNINIEKDYDVIPKAKGTIKPSVAFLRLANSKPMILKEALDLINGLEWNASKNPYLIKVVTAIMDLIEKHSNEVPSIEEKLFKACFGANYYDTFVRPLPKKEVIYDFLITQVSKIK